MISCERGWRGFYYRYFKWYNKDKENLTLKKY